MENSPTVIRPPPPPPQPPPSFFPSPPLSQPDNTTNSTTIRSPPPLPFFSSPPQQIFPIDQNGTFTIVNTNQPPPFPDSPRSVDLSPLEFILALMAVITIPALVYAFFFAVKCPPWTSRERDDHQESSGEFPRENHHGSSGEAIERRREAFSGVKYQKETHSKDIGSECPVCLSVFADGEEVRQLSGCKHSFHATCIDLWLNNHNNCPICRASVTVKRPNNNNNNNNRTAPPGSARGHNNDFHHGLPDAASLV